MGERPLRGRSGTFSPDLERASAALTAFLPLCARAAPPGFLRSGRSSVQGCGSQRSRPPPAPTAYKPPRSAGGGPSSPPSRSANPHRRARAPHPLRARVPEFLCVPYRYAGEVSLDESRRGRWRTIAGSQSPARARVGALSPTRTRGCQPRRSAAAAKPASPPERVASAPGAAKSPASALTVGPCALSASTAFLSPSPPGSEP